ncbi:dienelactone hydrolase family protein [uncultured Piscinibacter sp.]|uniref:dienelactone hydrolase family protein n=1 Tax=uncultured Piscinibacter sp. TaxID=1131835 RepID=UPI00260BBB93|nr:dienelactone hydrolase family protein [uncultured Piscinibacter sp.]
MENRYRAPAEGVRIGPQALAGSFVAVAQPVGVVAFAHGSGSSRASPRNRHVAEVLHSHRLCTLLLDLLSPEEAEVRQFVFDIDLLAERLALALDWLRKRPSTQGLRIGLFGASTGAAAALRTAARRPGDVAAVVSRGGRPDLAAAELPRVRAPTLLVVGGADTEVLALNREALRSLCCAKRLEVVPGATHLFEEPGALDAVAHLAADWFTAHLSWSSP